MPVIRSKKQKEPRQIAIPFGEETLQVTYNCRLLTRNYMKEIEANAELEGIEATIEFLLRVLIDWDLVDDKQKPWAITRETLGDLTFKELAEIQNAILDDIYPNPPAPATSSEDWGSFSSRAAAVEPVPTGTTT